VATVMYQIVELLLTQSYTQDKSKTVS